MKEGRWLFGSQMHCPSARLPGDILRLAPSACPDAARPVSSRLFHPVKQMSTEDSLGHALGTRAGHGSTPDRRPSTSRIRPWLVQSRFYRRLTMRTGSWKGCRLTCAPYQNEHRRRVLPVASCVSYVGLPVVGHVKTNRD